MTPPPSTTQITGTRAPARERGFRIQPRDLEIVDAVHRLRVLSTEQIATLFFPSTSGNVSSACRTRLRYLSQAGYLDRREQLQTKAEGRRPYLYMLTALGRDLLIDELGLEQEDVDWEPSYNSVRWPFLRHQLGINDAYIAFSQAVDPIGWSLDIWTDDRILKKEHVDRVPLPEGSRKVAVVPDAYFVLVSGDGSTTLHFFLEIDRGTMTVASSRARVKSWADKIRAYQAYVSSGQIEKRYGTTKIRVMTVTSSQSRLVNLKEATEAVGGRRRYWFTTAAELSPESALQRPLWQVATEDGIHTLISRP